MFVQVPGDGGHAADIGRRRHGQQGGQRLKLHLPRDAEHERRQHQADDVVDEERGKKPAGENHCRQQLMRLEPLEHRLCIPLEETDQVQVPDDQHHRKKQHDRLEIGVTECVPGPHDAKGGHAYCTNDRRPSAVDLQPGKLAQGKHHVAGEENEVGRQHAEVRQRGGRNGSGHLARSE
jgi:hypothetical protein